MRVATYHSWIMAWVLGLGLSLGVVMLRQWGWLEAWELGVYDWCLRLQTHLTTPDPRLLLIGITEQDIRMQAQWPLSDATVAQLLHKVLAAHPRAIGLDFYRDLAVPPGHDALQTLLTAHPEIMAITKAPTPGSSGVAPPLALPPEQIGFSDFVVDADGVVRRGLLFLHSDQVPLTALGVRLAWRYLQGEGIVPQPDPRQPGQLRVGTTTLPPLEPNTGSYVQADTRGYQILLDYQGLKPHPAFVSLTAVLSDAVDPRIFQDKVVLIGVMAESVPDLFQTPLSRGRRSHRMSHGVELHAQLASQLMRAGTDGQAPLTTLAEWQEVSWILLWGVLGSLSSVWVRSPWHSGLISLSAVALLGLLVLGLFFLRRWLPLLPPVLAWGLCSTVMTAYVAHQERQTRHLITQLFMSQVPPEIVNLLWERRQELLDGRRLQPCSLTATVLFVDLKGYTPIAENMAPQALMRWLNIYLETMAEVIINHHGIIDDYAGDAIKANFGVPFARETHQAIGLDATYAVHCALSMAQELEKLNMSLSQQGLPTFGIRIGISTGVVVAGCVGSPQRLKYTTVGDTVNITARLESFDPPEPLPQQASASCRIFIDESTMHYVNHQFRMIPLPSLQIKGKATPLNIYSVL